MAVLNKTNQDRLNRNTMKSRQTIQMGPRFRTTTMALGTQNNVKKVMDDKGAGFYCSNTLEIDKIAIKRALKKHEARRDSGKPRTLHLKKNS